MNVIDKQFVTLNNNGQKIKIVVYLKEVTVRGGTKTIRPLCRVVDEKKLDEYELMVQQA